MTTYLAGKPPLLNDVVVRVEEDVFGPRQLLVSPHQCEFHWIDIIAILLLRQSVAADTSVAAAAGFFNSLISCALAVIQRRRRRRRSCRILLLFDDYENVVVDVVLGGQIQIRRQLQHLIHRLAVKVH